MSDSSLDIQSLFSLEGKVALVTGGSRGIGYMITQGLLQALIWTTESNRRNRYGDQKHI